MIDQDHVGGETSVLDHRFFTIAQLVVLSRLKYQIGHSMCRLSSEEFSLCSIRWSSCAKEHNCCVSIGDSLAQVCLQTVGSSWFGIFQYAIVLT